MTANRGRIFAATIVRQILKSAQTGQIGNAMPIHITNFNSESQSTYFYNMNAAYELITASSILADDVTCVIITVTVMNEKTVLNAEE